VHFHEYKLGDLGLALAGAMLLVAISARAESLFSGDPGATFTVEQLQRGQAAYTRSCLSCHGPGLEGTQFAPPLRGATFESHWRGRSRAVLSTQIRTTMPPGGIGSLSGQAYTDIEAYILQANAASGPAAPPSQTAPSAATTPPQAAPRPPAPPMISPVPKRDDDPHYLAATKARDQKLAAITPVTEEMLEHPAPSDWLVWRRAYDALGYSPLRQISRSNVARLRTAWSWTLPQSTNEITPLVHDGVMFIYSGPAVQALDAATGELLWQYLRSLPDEFDNGRRAHAKSMAIFAERLFAPTADGHIVALDVHTGHLMWDQEVVAKAGRPAAIGWQLSGGPIVAKGKVIMGVSLGVQEGGGCYIVGLDADSGKESWRFHTIARPGEPGGDSWNGAPVEERFGAGVWTAGSYDPQLNLVYFGIGNTYDTATLLEPRPGAAGVTSNDGLYTDSTVALRPETGSLVWHYQHQRRDVWDLDWVFEQSIVTLPIDGHPIKLVVTGGKTAMFDAVDAASGKFVFSADLGFQNLVTAIDPNTGEKTMSAAVQPEAGKPKLICPNSFGARNWPATALNPETHVLYTPILENCADYIYAPREATQTAQGGLDVRFVPRLMPDHDGNFGRLAALDLRTRRVIWTHRQRIPLASSTLATAGGLLFEGDVDRYFAAYDQATGKVLWRTRLSAPAESSPVTYSANNRQYVAVVTGSGSPFGAASRAFVPEVVAPAAGVTVVVLELP
jgi:PQQ-dependent dehydrogenase (methanol/ethanol family)